MAGLFGGGGPSQPGGFDWMSALQILGATLQDVNEATHGRQGGNVLRTQDRMTRLGDQKRYQDMIKGAIGAESPNTVMSTPSVFEPSRLPQVQAAKANDAQSMMFSGPMGQALGYEQSAAALPMLQNMDPQIGLPALMSMMGQAQERQARKGERVEDRQWQVEDRTQARQQTVQDNAVRPATPEEKKQFGFRPETPLFMDGFGKPIPLQDPNAITPYQQQSLGLQRQQIQASAANRNAAPTGYRWSGDGSKMEVIPGGPADTTGVRGKATDTQRVTALYADRARQSNDILTGSKDKPGMEAQGSSLAQSIKSALPGGNYLVSNEFQKYDQARRNFVNAVLRKESGAVISPEEFANADKQYFPQPGDNQDVIEQKRANRETAIEGLRRASGTAMNEMPSPANQQVPAATQSANVPRVTSAMEYERLPSGSEYIAPDGQKRRKR